MYFTFSTLTTSLLQGTLHMQVAPPLCSYPQTICALPATRTSPMGLRTKLRAYYALQNEASSTTLPPAAPEATSSRLPAVPQLCTSRPFDTANYLIEPHSDAVGSIFRKQKVAGPADLSVTGSRAGTDLGSTTDQPVEAKSARRLRPRLPLRHFGAFESSRGPRQVASVQDDRAFDTSDPSLRQRALADPTPDPTPELANGEAGVGSESGAPKLNKTNSVQYMTPHPDTRLFRGLMSPGPEGCWTLDVARLLEGRVPLESRSEWCPNTPPSPVMILSTSDSSEISEESSKHEADTDIVGLFKDSLDNPERPSNMDDPGYYSDISCSASARSDPPVNFDSDAFDLSYLDDYKASLVINGISLYDPASSLMSGTNRFPHLVSLTDLLVKAPGGQQSPSSVHHIHHFDTAEPDFVTTEAHDSIHGPPFTTLSDAEGVACVASSGIAACADTSVASDQGEGSAEQCDSTRINMLIAKAVYAGNTYVDPFTSLAGPVVAGPEFMPAHTSSEYSLRSSSTESEFLTPHLNSNTEYLE